MASPRDILELILKSTTPPDGYSVENYISVSYLSRARTQDYSIKLVYEYEKNATSGTAIIVEDMKEALKIVEVLETFKHKKEKKVKLTILGEPNNDTGKW